MGKTAHDTGTEYVSFANVTAESHDEALAEIAEELPAGMPWEKVELVNKVSIEGPKQNFTFKVTAPHDLDW